MSLLIRRRVIERFTKSGLYPYSQHYLDASKSAPALICQPFNTIGSTA